MKCQDCGANCGKMICHECSTNKLSFEELEELQRFEDDMEYFSNAYEYGELDYGELDPDELAIVGMDDDQFDNYIFDHLQSDDGYWA